MRLSRLLLASFAFVAAPLFFPVLAQTSSLPPTPPIKAAVNPVTGKVYTLDTAGNSVSVVGPAGYTAAIPVGGGPTFIAVNPATNRVYVDNDDATLAVIDGTTDTLLGTFPVDSTGPITVNPLTNMIYIVRMTGPQSDEVLFFNGATNTSYAIATGSFQPTAMAVNPLTDTIYVAHYATGDVRVISGAFDPSNDFPATTSIGVFSHPFAIAANPVTNKVYVITQDPRGPIGVIDGVGNTAVFPSIAPGHAAGPQAIAVNPVSNKAYAAFANEVVAIDGRTNALTYIPISGGSSGGIALGIDSIPNKVFAFTADGTVNVIDGDTDTVVATGTGPAGTTPSIGVNPATGAAYFFDGTLAARTDTTGDTVHTVPLTTSIQPLPNDTSPASGTITMDAASGFSPNALPVRAVYYQIDSTGGAWSQAAGGGPYTASFSNLGPGAHTIHAFAVDGQEAALSSGAQSAPVTGNVASYTFTVAASKVDPSVSLASSTNPSSAGQSVTFTAAVSGNAGAATGSVTFLDGSTTICSSVGLASGSAACTTSSLVAGSHTITARYSGDTHYNAATSADLAQTVQAPSSGGASSITSPTPGSAFGSTSITFSWDAGTGVTQWFLAVGTAPGGNDLFGGYVSTQSQTVSGLPANGATLYVTLMSMINGAWQTKSYTYTAMSGGQSSVVYPVPGSVLPSTSVVFSWTPGTGVTQRFLAVGTTPGGNDLFGGYVTDLTSQAVTGLPVNGTPVYVRLMSMINGAWQSFDYTYSGMTAAQANLSNVTSPVPGSVLPPSTIFNWTAGNGVTDRFLAVGTILGGNDIYGSYEGASLSQPITGIPRNGATLYVTLMSFINGNWQTNNYIYTAASPALSVITSPVSGATLSGPSVTFTWDAGMNVTNRFLAVGTILGGNDIYGSYEYDAMSQTITGLPPGRTLYVRLMSQINGAWQYYDFTYTTQ